MARDLPTVEPDLVIHGADHVDAQGTTADRWVAVSNGVITALGTGDGWHAFDLEATTVVDASGRHLTAGMIDVHVHGGNGRLHDEGAEAIAAALDCHRAHGTTRSILSLVTNPLDRMCSALAAIAQVMQHDPTVIGAHAEGPFLHPERRGAHQLQHLLEPRPEHVDRLLAAANGTLRQITIAPELPGADHAIDRFLAAGVIVAIGHTDADVAAARAAFDRGARILTHTFNGMRPMHHRAPGPAIAAMNDHRVALEIIADGHHVHPELIRTVFTAAPGRVMLITDAMSAACCGGGDFQLGHTAVTVADGRATIAGTDVLAGSTITQDVAVRNAIVTCGIDPVAAVAAATSTPARVFGLDDRFGTIAVGRPADLVLFDADWHPSEVWIDGNARLRRASAS